MTVLTDERRDALEEAAKIAETMYDDPDGHERYRAAGTMIAAAIRKLIEAKP